MQILDKKDIVNRILFYWSRMFSSSIKSGESYNNLKKTIVILITDYSLENLRKIEKTTSKWQIREAEYLREILTELFEIYIIEVPKIRKYGEPNRAIEKWLKFIENPEVIGMEDLESNEAMKKAKKVLEEISEDEKEQYLAEQRLVYIMDQKALEAAGYDKGMKDGEKKGIEKIARKLLELNLSIEQIQEATGLSEEEVERLRN